MTNDDTRGYTLTRFLDAPRELVWQCCTQPEHVAVWFGGHQGVTEQTVLDARVGGRWRSAMELPGGKRVVWSGEFLEVERPTRLVLAFSDQEVLGTEFETFTVTLNDLGDKTELCLRQSGGHFDDRQYGQAQSGTASFLDVIAELLTTLQQTP